MNTKGNQIVKNKKTESYQKLLKEGCYNRKLGSNSPVEDVAQDKHSLFERALLNQENTLILQSE